MSKKVVILLSGGVDSTALLYRLFVKGEHLDSSDDTEMEIFPVFVNYGQETAEVELKAVFKVMKMCRNLAIFADSEHKLRPLFHVMSQVGPCTLKNNEVAYGNNHPAYVPYRNMLLLSLALSQTEHVKPDYIVMGVHNIDVVNRFPDCSGDFAEVIQQVVNMYTGDHLCEVVFPYCTDQFQSKADIIAGVPAELLAVCASGYGDTLAAKLTNAANTSDHV